jgi:heme-degrading monooxygenase HmoA
MMTVVTTTRLRPGAEQEWDAAMRERFDSARGRPGWVSGQLLAPEDGGPTRVIVGTWRTRDDWSGWHHDPAFLDRRSTLERLEVGPSRSEWFDVVVDARADG